MQISGRDGRFFMWITNESIKTCVLNCIVSSIKIAVLLSEVLLLKFNKACIDDSLIFVINDANIDSKIVENFFLGSRCTPFPL